MTNADAVTYLTVLAETVESKPDLPKEALEAIRMGAAALCDPDAFGEQERKVLDAAGILAAMLFVDGIVRDRTFATMSKDVQDAIWRVAESAFERMAAGK